MEKHNDGPILGDLSEIDNLLAKFADPVGQDQETEDSYSDEESLVGYLGRKGANHRVWLSEDVHLKVVSDLVIGWNQAGKSGKWPIHSIRWAARELGQGNRPWYIATLDLEDNNHRVWRLTKGGQSKREITIKEIGSYRRTYVMN